MRHLVRRLGNLPRLLLVLVLATETEGVVRAQTPTGTVRGIVQDQTGAAVHGAEVFAVSVATGLKATAAISVDTGHYGIPELLPGDYDLKIRAKGFQEITRRVRVQTGATAVEDFQLQVEGLSTVIDVGGTVGLETGPAIGGAITRAEIESLPLNGLNFLDLGKTEPGVQATTSVLGGRTFVPTLGGPGGNNGRGTRSTVDGASIMAVGNGGSAMGFSSEVIEEFRISTVNFDLSTGLTATGAINAVTRSGGKDFTGTAFYFFRDHKLGAYPVLNRSAVDPDPFFQRRQFGLTVSGPIRRERVFFSGSWQQNDQRAAVATTLLDPDFSHLSRITTSPSLGNQYVARIDGSITPMHSGFLRYAYDGGNSFSPAPLFRSNQSPSNWPVFQSRNHQGVAGVTSVLSRSLVNALRVSYFFNLNRQETATEKECPACLGVGSPAVLIPASSLFVGNFDNISVTDGRRFQLNDWGTLYKGSHVVVFGVDWEHNRGGALGYGNEPATLQLFSPSQARQAGIAVPTRFDTIGDILSLPLRSVSLGVGDPRIPQTDGGRVRQWNTLRLHFQDSWRFRPTVTFNYGLAWSMDRNLNYDLAKPQLLAPLLGEDGLRPTPKQWRNFSPAAGFAWNVTPNTVVRGGSGIYYDFLFPPNLETERAALGPPGLGRLPFTGDSIENPIAGIPGVPLGTRLNFTRATAFLGSHLISILPQERAKLQPSGSSNSGVQQIQLTKALAGGGLNTDFPSMYAIHAGTGVRRQIGRTFELGADFVYRRFVHFGIGATDVNRSRRAQGPLLPVCTASQQNDPNAVCAAGVINITQPVGLATYKGLLVRAEKYWSAGHWFKASWAYSKNVGTSSTNVAGFNLDNWHENTGPLNIDVPHIFNAAGSVQFPWRLNLGFNFSYSSPPGFSASIDTIDLNGDGTTTDLLPGSTVNAFNRGMERSDLERLVAEFNQNYSGKTDGLGTRIPTITLPQRYAFGDSLQTLDLRLSRSFDFQERYRFTLIGEVFNAYNAANLSGYSGNLTNVSTFGQPNARAGQVVGSGGPRAFQLAARVRF